MKIHKTGYSVIFVFFLIILVLNIPIVYFLRDVVYIAYPYYLASVIFFALIIRFFRVPSRELHNNENLIYAPADGRIVVIEEVEEKEYFKDKRMQISIFMSPYNVHMQWHPISGVVKYFKYHKGKFLTAWQPKSSEENERTTIVVTTNKGEDILFRQIAGAVARRIVTYLKVGDKAVQNTDFGFIKFGSRVDVFLPLDAKIKVNLDDKTVGSQTIIAEL